MYLYLMRHGDAEPTSAKNPYDAQRPLSPKGRKDVETIGKELKRRGVRFDLILSSPLRRAIETAERLTRALGPIEIQRADGLAPMGEGPSLRPFLKTLERKSSALLIGHQPDMGLLLTSLTAPAPPTLMTLRPATVVALRWNLNLPRAEFQWSITPSDLPDIP